MEEPEFSNKQDKSELLILYQVTSQDLAYFKDQQWTLSKYTLVAFAAIIGIPRIPNVNVSPCGRLILCLSATVVAVIASWVIWQLRTSIEDRRQRNERIFPNLSQSFRSARGERTAVSSAAMYLFFVALLGIGLSFVWWLVYFVK